MLSWRCRPHRFPDEALNPHNAKKARLGRLGVQEKWSRASLSRSRINRRAGGRAAIFVFTHRLPGVCLRAKDGDTGLRSLVKKTAVVLGGLIGWVTGRRTPLSPGALRGALGAVGGFKGVGRRRRADRAVAGFPGALLADLVGSVGCFVRRAVAFYGEKYYGPTPGGKKPVAKEAVS